MIRTKRHSQNAVAGRARLRTERAQHAPDPPAGKVPVPRRPKADFIIRIEAKSGERVQISLVRWGKRFLTPNGFKSARQISRGIEMLIRYIQ
jgi:hypothetical protein